MLKKVIETAVTAVVSATVYSIAGFAIYKVVVNDTKKICNEIINCANAEEE